MNFVMVKSELGTGAWSHWLIRGQESDRCPLEKILLLTWVDQAS